MAESPPGSHQAGRPRPVWVALLLANAIAAVAVARVGRLEALLPRQTIVVLGSDRFQPGGRASLRVILRDPAGGEGIAGAEVSVGFEGHQTVTRRTDNAGTFELALAVPDQSGPAELRISARSRRGTSRLRRDVSIGRRLNGVLSSDLIRYRPGQTVCLRAVLTEHGTGRAASGAGARFEVFDPAGRKLLHHAAIAGPSGIIACELPLDTGAALGAYRIALADGADLLAERTVAVVAAEPPAFDVALSPGTRWHRPGDGIAAAARATYRFGAPVVGATARLEATSGGMVVAGVTGRTDASGSIRWRVPAPHLPQGTDRLELRATVIDGRGRAARAASGLPVSREPVVGTVVPECGGLVPRLTNRLYVITTEPDGRPISAPFAVRAGSTEVRGTTDESGIAAVELAGGGGRDGRDLVLRVGHGRPRRIALPTAGAVILRPDRAIYRAGETCQLTAFTPPGVEAVYFDVVRAGQTVMTRAARPVNGQCGGSVAIEESLAGLLTIRAWAATGDGSWSSTTRRVVVIDGRALHVSLESDAERYAPGDTARIQVRVQDSDGQPAPAWVGLEVVRADAAAPADPAAGAEPLLRLLTPGLARQPLGADSARLLGVLEASTRATLSSPEQQAVAAACLARAGEAAADRPNLRADSYREQVAGARRLRRGLGGRVAVGFGLELLALCLWASARAGRLARGLATAVWLAAATAGAWLARPEAPAPEPGAPAADREAVEASPADAPACWAGFSETLLALPEIATDEDGHATIELPLTGGATSWRLTARASSASGDLGVAQAVVTSSQPFWSECDLPDSLSVGDRVVLPVTVCNATDRAQDVAVELRPEPTIFDLVSPSDVNVRVGPRAARVVPCVLIAERPGRGRLGIVTRAGDAASLAEREVQVEPNGGLTESAVGGVLLAPAEHRVALPAETLPYSRHLELAVYPSLAAQMEAAVSSLREHRHDDLRSAASAALGSVLLLRRWRTAGAADAEAVAHEAARLALDYQRLLTFETPGGGFAWRLGEPTEPVPTAVALATLGAMATERCVDGPLIDRCIARLVGLQQADGTWRPGPADLGPTALAAWSLAEFGGPLGRASARRAVAPLAAGLELPAEAGTVALGANALLSVAPGSRGARRAVERLRALARQGDGTARWEGQGRSVLGSSGASAEAETTGFALLALTRAQAAPELVGGARRALEMLRGSDGGWGAEQATAAVLQAWAAASDADDTGGDGTVTATVGGRQVGSVRIDAKSRHRVQRLDLTQHFRRGDNVLGLACDGSARPVYQVVERYALPHGAATPVPSGLRVDWRMDQPLLHVDRPASAVLTLRDERGRADGDLVVEVGLPPGFEVEQAAREAIGCPAGWRCRIDRGRLRLVPPELPAAGLELRFTLTPRLAVRATVPPAVVYAAGDPARRAESPARSIEVVP